MLLYTHILKTCGTSITVIVDGDEMRDSILLGAGFSLDERSEHNYRVARLVRELVKQINVIVSVIAPVIYTRRTISANYPMISFVYIRKMMPYREGHFYEELYDYLTIDTDTLSIEKSVDRLREIIDSVNNKTKVPEGDYVI